jgi:hypothetical protein
VQRNQQESAGPRRCRRQAAVALPALALSRLHDPASITLPPVPVDRGRLKERDLGEPEVGGHGRDLSGEDQQGARLTERLAGPRPPVTPAWPADAVGDVPQRERGRTPRKTRHHAQTRMIAAALPIAVPNGTEPNRTPEAVPWSMLVGC